MNDFKKSLKTLKKFKTGSEQLEVTERLFRFWKRNTHKKIGYLIYLMNNLNQYEIQI